MPHLNANQPAASTGSAGSVSNQQPVSAEQVDRLLSQMLPQADLVNYLQSKWGLNQNDARKLADAVKAVKSASVESPEDTSSTQGARAKLTEVIQGQRLGNTSGQETVRSGDTIWSIAKRAYPELAKDSQGLMAIVDAIKEANPTVGGSKPRPIGDGSKLSVGDKLTMPSAETIGGARSHLGKKVDQEKAGALQGQIDSARKEFPEASEAQKKILGDAEKALKQENAPISERQAKAAELTKKFSDSVGTPEQQKETKKLEGEVSALLKTPGLTSDRKTRLDAALRHLSNGEPADRRLTEAKAQIEQYKTLTGEETKAKTKAKEAEKKQLETEAKATTTKGKETSAAKIQASATLGAKASEIAQKVVDALDTKGLGATFSNEYKNAMEVLEPHIGNKELMAAVKKQLEGGPATSASKGGHGRTFAELSKLKFDGAEGKQIQAMLNGAPKEVLNAMPKVEAAITNARSAASGGRSKADPDTVDAPALKKAFPNANSATIAAAYKALYGESGKAVEQYLLSTNSGGGI